MEKIGVRDLVTFVLKSGSIDSRATASSHTAQEGTRIHQMLQKQGGPNYEKEVYLSQTIPLGKGEIIVDGRADGIIREGERITIDEIKTSEPEFDHLIPGTVDLFWAQLMCYGYFLCQSENLAEIELRLTYYQTTTKKITRIPKTYTAAQLTDFFANLTTSFEAWVIFREDWHDKRNQSLSELKFPYGAYRKGQRELAVAVYKTILTQKLLFTEAPTGTGKTISTLFPVLKGMGEGLLERVFYLTAKTSTRQVAESALADMGEAGMALKSVTLTAKDKICFMEERICTPDYCPYANGYYDRVKDGLMDMLTHEDQFTRPVIESYAQKHTLCPFEFSLDASNFSDAVICDYNYLFDPRVYLQRFFNVQNEENFFLVDEVHNLVSRSRNMYSAELNEAMLKTQYKQWDKPIQKSKIGRATKRLIDTFKKTATTLTQVTTENDDADAQVHFDEKYQCFLTNQPLEKFNKAIQNYVKYVHDWLPDQGNSPLADQVLLTYLEVLNYLKITEFYDETYTTIMTRHTYKHSVTWQVKQLCLDPAHFLHDSLKIGGGAVLFSATLSPLPYYNELLGGGDEGLNYQLPSPFPPQNQEIMIAKYVDTKYQNRQASLDQIVDSLGLLMAGKMGNYLFFFPSYNYLNQVLERFNQLYPQINTIQQEKEMSDADRDHFLQQFKKDPTENLAGFCVLGGAFSEGIDLKGTRLVGVSVISVGLPGLSAEQNLLMNYFEHKNGQGFQYAYQLPGLNNVLQAAGRLIRTMSDEGIILLLDNRFATNRYTQLFPEHWQRYTIINSTQQLIRDVTQFWRHH